MDRIIRREVNEEGLSREMATDFLPKKASQMGQALAAHGAVTEFFVTERTQTGENAFRSRYGLRQGKAEWIITITTDRNGVIFGLTYENP